jgi:predicted lipoprotein with Yx(FWY)xxD motif
MSRTAGAAVVLLLALAGCAAADDATAPARSEPSPTVTSAEADETASDDDGVTADEAEPAASGPVITTTGSAHGTVLVDGRRQAIYLFDREAGRTPRCYGACADAWPPVLAKGDAQARRQVRGGLLGTVPRRNGTRQVTYAGHPLYFYAHEGPGQLLCHDISEYGGRWLAVTPRGVAAPT